MKRRDAVCLDTMGWSDSINHPKWPQTLLKAGKIYKTTTKFIFIAIMILSLALLTSCKSNKDVITYSLYPYLLDSEHYRDVIEKEWSELEPDIELEFVDYDCYYDGAPDGIDVIMYDACLEDEFVDAGYLQTISESDIDDINDFFEYSIQDISKDGELYGIPAILCSEFLIYDKRNETADNASCIQDMSYVKEEFLVNVNYSYSSLYVDYLADKTGEYDPDNQSFETDDEALDYIKASCNKDYYDNTTYELAEAYCDGKCDAFLGYSETLSMVGDRIDQTAIKPLSLTKNEDIPLYFADVVGLSSNVDESKREACIKLMNLICSTEVMIQNAVIEDVPSYLIFPRKSVYNDIINEYPMYKTLYEFTCDTKNRISR